MNGGSLQDLVNPVFAFTLLAAVAIFAWAISYLVPFYRKELAVEDSTRLTPLDGLRGLLCFGVMICHSAVSFDVVTGGEWKPLHSNLYSLLGTESVSLFFCITAFLFWGRILAKKGSIDIRQFLRARLFRIVPVYLFGCLLIVIAVAPRVHLVSFAAARALAPMALMGTRAWGSLGPVNLWLVNAGVCWSLQFEWGFYLLLPALAPIAKSGRASLFIWLFIAALALGAPGKILIFFAGILAVYASLNPEVVAFLRRPAISCGMLLVAAAFPLITDTGYGFAGAILTTLLFVPIACGNDLFGLLTLRGLRVMGLISYSVYLLHGTVLYLCRPMLAQVKRNAPDQAVVWHYWAAIVVIGLATCGLSLLTYRWIEWPFIQFEHRLRRSPRTADLVKHIVASTPPPETPAEHGLKLPPTVLRPLA